MIRYWVIAIIIRSMAVMGNWFCGGMGIYNLEDVGKFLEGVL